MKRIVEGDERMLVCIARARMIGSRGLDRTFDRLGARIGEEHRVGERCGDQALGQFFLAGNTPQIGDVPELARLFLYRLHQIGMGVAETGHRETAGEIEIASAVSRPQIGALAPFEGDKGGLPRMAVMPRSAARVEMAWDVSGLAGTGSHDLVVDKVIVPEMNTGQLKTVLRDQYLVDAKPLNKVSGQPFRIAEIEAAIEEALA